MNKIYFWVLLVILALGCQEVSSEKVEEFKEKDNPKLKIVNLEEHQTNYTRLKNEIFQKRVQLKNRTDISELERMEIAEQYISKILIDSVFEYWAGTKWDFNGYTETPRIGEIACGYYVTTPLRDIGVKINRFKVAQKAASGIVKELCKLNTIKTFNKIEELEKYLRGLANEEILIVGLDNHVGFIFKRNDENYFAHSNYIGSSGVVKEKLETSRAINSSNIYMVGQLTKNPKFIREWLR